MLLGRMEATSKAGLAAEFDDAGADLAGTEEPVLVWGGVVCAGRVGRNGTKEATTRPRRTDRGSTFRRSM